MATVSWIVLAKDVLEDNNGNTVIVSPITTLVVDKFPQKVNIRIAFGLKDLDRSSDKKIKIGVGQLVKNQLASEPITNNNIKNMLGQGEMKLPELFNNEEEVYADFETSIILNDFEFKEKGNYFASIQLDNSGLTTFFNVTNSEDNN
ncbi:hypothetical protein [Staphylococcus hominis]